MDILSFIGLFAAIFLMVFGMTDSFKLLGNITANFVDPPSIAITVGGTFATLMLMFPLRTFISLGKIIGRVFFPKKFAPQEYITQLVEFADVARKGSVLNLEDKISGCKDDFMKKGLTMAVDMVDPDEIRESMETELGFMIDRHKEIHSFFEKGASLAPGFGMLGTLIGLINMLGDMQDIEKLTGGMATALITTFYGSVLANVIFIPMGNKLKKQSDDEILCRQIIIEGILGVTVGETPKKLFDKLYSMIPPKMRKSADDMGGRAAASDEE